MEMWTARGRNTWAPRSSSLSLCDLSPWSLQLHGCRVATLLHVSSGTPWHTHWEKDSLLGAVLPLVTQPQKSNSVTSAILYWSRQLQNPPSPHFSVRGSQCHMSKRMRYEIYNIIRHKGLVGVQSWHFREEFKRNHIIMFWELGKD